MLNKFPSEFLFLWLLTEVLGRKSSVAEVTLMEWCCHNWWFALHSLSSSWWSESYLRRPPRSSTTPLKFPFFEAAINKCSEWIVLSRPVINSCTNKCLGPLHLERAKNYGLLPVVFSSATLETFRVRISYSISYVIFDWKL